MVPVAPLIPVSGASLLAADIPVLLEPRLFP